MSLRVGASVIFLCVLIQLTAHGESQKSQQESAPPSHREAQLSSATVGTNESPIVNIDDVIIALDAIDQAVESLQAAYHCESRFNFGKPGTEPRQKGLIEDDAVSMTRSAEVSWEATRDGRGRMEAVF